MTATRNRLLASIALVALLGACGDKKPKTPTGQVVATVDGTDITVHELNAEASTAQAPPEVPRKTIEQAALQRIIERRVLADAATKRGLEKSPGYLLQQQRMEDTLRVQALQSDIVSKVPKTTREAAEKYIAAHPGQFAERKIYTVDQIAFLRPANIATLGLEKANTLPEVEAILKANSVEYRRQPGNFDSLQIDPRLAAEIEKILARNPNEVFLFADQPRGAPAPIVFVNMVTDTKPQPFTGEKAITLAQQVIQRQTVQERLAAEFKTLMAADKDKIVYAAGYAPPAKPVAAKPGATVTPPPAAAPAAATPPAP